MRTKDELLREAYMLISRANRHEPEAAHVRIQKAFALIELAKQLQDLEK
jgi:hypothetical protein